MEEQKKHLDQSKTSPGVARRIVYALIILLALTIVPWTFYAQHLFKKGDSLRVKSKYTEAADLLKKSQRISLSFQVNRKELSKAYLDVAGGLASQDQPDYALCEDLCKRAIALSDDPAKAHRELSDVYWGQKKYDDALAQMEEYLKLMKNDASAKKLRDGREYFATHAKATDMADRAAKLQKQGKLDEAIEAYEQTVKEYRQFPFVRKQAAEAYIEKYAALSAEAQKIEGEKLLASALAIVEKNHVSDELKAVLGNAEEIKKKGAHYKLAAIYARLGDFDKAVHEYEKQVAENPDDKNDDLAKALQKAKTKAAQDAQRSMASGAGGQMGAPGNPGEIRDFMAGSGGGFRERFKHTIELTQTIRKLAKLEGDAAISTEQAGKLLPILDELEKAEKMPQEDAKTKVASIKGVLSEAQLAALEKIELPRPQRGAGGGGRGPRGGRGPSSGGQRRGGFDPDANPFKRERNKDALTELVESLKKKASAEVRK